MANKPTITERGNVEVEKDGKKYFGTYAVEGRRRMPMIRVTGPDGQEKTAVLRSMQPENLARILLREMIS